MFAAPRAPPPTLTRPAATVRSYANRVFQCECEPCFRRNLDALAFCRHLNGGAGAGPCHCSDGRASSTTRESADDGSECGAAANHFLASAGTRCALFGDGLGVHVDGS